MQSVLRAAFGMLPALALIVLDIMKRTIYTLFFLVTFGPSSAQSFADAIKDGFSPLGNLLKKEASER